MMALLAEAGESLRVLPHVDELIFGSIAFLVLAVALLKLAFPKAKKVLEDRSRQIQGRLEDAERVKREADQVLEQYRAQLAEARVEVQKIIDEGKRTAEAVKADIVRKAEEEAAAVLARARADVAGERDRALDQLRTSLGDWSIQLASRVIEKELSSDATQRALVDRAIEDLIGSGNGGGRN